MNILLPKLEDGRYLLKLDASILSKSNCLRAIYHELLLGLKPKGDTYKMDYGTAGHKFMAAWYGGKAIQYALDAATNFYRDVAVPESDWRKLAHLEACLEGYVREYPSSEDTLKPLELEAGEYPVIVGDEYVKDVVVKKPALEHYFELDWLETDKLKVLLCGTMDFRGTSGDEKVILDHKFHALYRGFKSEDEAIKEWLHEKVRTVQGDIYRLAARRLWGEDYGFQINGVFLKKDGKNRYERSEVFRRSKEGDIAFEAWLAEKIDALVIAVNGLIKHEDSQRAAIISYFTTNRLCCNNLEEGWPCKFSCLCDAPDDEKRSFIQEEMFTSQVRDPSLFQK